MRAGRENVTDQLEYYGPVAFGEDECTGMARQACLPRPYRIHLLATGGLHGDSYAEATCHKFRI